MDALNYISTSLAAALGHKLHLANANAVRNYIETKNYNSLIRLAAQYAPPLMVTAIIVLAVAVLTLLTTFLIYIVRCVRRRRGGLGSGGKVYRDPRLQIAGGGGGNRHNNGLAGGAAYSNVVVGSQMSGGGASTSTSTQSRLSQCCLPLTLVLIIFILNVLAALAITGMLLFNQKSVRGITTSAQTIYSGLDQAEQYLNSTENSANKYSDSAFERFEQQMETGMLDIRQQVLSAGDEILQNFSSNAGNNIINRIQLINNLLGQVDDAFGDIQRNQSAIPLEQYRQQLLRMLNASVFVGSSQGRNRLRLESLQLANNLRWNDQFQQLLSAAALPLSTLQQSFDNLPIEANNLNVSSMQQRMHEQINQQADALMQDFRRDMQKSRMDFQHQQQQHVPRAALEQITAVLEQAKIGVDINNNNSPTAAMTRKSVMWLGIIPVILLCIPIVLFLMALLGALLHTRKKTKKIRYNDYYQSVPVHRSRTCERSMLHVAFVVCALLLVVYAVIFNAYMLIGVTSYMTLCYNDTTTTANSTRIIYDTHNNNASAASNNITAMRLIADADTTNVGNNKSPQLLFNTTTTSNNFDNEEDDDDVIPSPNQYGPPHDGPLAFEILSEFINNYNRRRLNNSADTSSSSLTLSQLSLNRRIDINAILKQCSRNASLYTALALDNNSGSNKNSNINSSALQQLKQHVLDTIRQHIRQFDDKLLHDIPRRTIQQQQFIPQQLFERLKFIAEATDATAAAAATIAGQQRGGGSLDPASFWQQILAINVNNLPILQNNLSIPELTNKLRGFISAAALPESQPSREVKDLTDELERFGDLLDNSLLPNITRAVGSNMQRVQRALERLQQAFVSNSSSSKIISPSEFARQLAQQLQTLEDDTKRQAIQAITAVADEAPQRLSTQAVAYVEEIFRDFQQNFGQCAVLSAAVVSSTNAVCEQVIIPTLSYTTLFFFAMVVLFCCMWLALALADWWHMRALEHEADAAVYENTYDTYDYYRYG